MVVVQLQATGNVEDTIRVLDACGNAVRLREELRAIATDRRAADGGNQQSIEVYGAVEFYRHAVTHFEPLKLHTGTSLKAGHIQNRRE